MYHAGGVWLKSVEKHLQSRQSYLRAYKEERERLFTKLDSDRTIKAEYKSSGKVQGKTETYH